MLRLRRIPETQLVVVLSLMLGAGILGAAITTAVIGLGKATAQTVREYTLEIVPTDIDYGGGNVWHAWTFKLADQPKGTVPGPALTVTVGEKLRVRVRNRHNLVHSFHTHLSHYTLENDGSQLNIISGRGPGAMIPPGGEYVYEFEPTEPGIYYYHCHSADGGLMISQHIKQGLYGAIIVKAKDEPPIRDEVIFMSEIGHETEGDMVPPFIMNGLGLPGGEHRLEEIFHQQGLAGVQAQLGKTVPLIKARVGEPIRLHVINIGDVIHSFHMHHASHVSIGALQGRPWPANVVPLVPGAADTLRVVFTEPGLWLFHCHVVSHADAGMIGLFAVEEAPAQR